MKKLKCESCEKKKDTTKKRTRKENGVLGYYDVDVLWCDDCINANNRHLLESWG